MVECNRMGCCNFGFLLRIESEDDHIQHILIKMAVVVSSRIEAKVEIKDVISKFPDDDEFRQYKKELDDMFSEGARKTTHDTDQLTSKKDGQPSLDIVLRQPQGDDDCKNRGFNEEPLPRIWLSPGFIEAIDKVVDNTISNSKMKQSYAGITSPTFDLGISPMKQAEPLNMDWHEEIEGVVLNKNRKGVEGSPSLKKRNVRSPRMQMPIRWSERLVENLSWVTISGPHIELLFSMPNDMNLHRHAIESLARTTTVYISVIDAWATFLNYEERFRNRDSLRHYSLTLKLWYTDTKLRSKCVNHNTQYALFKKGGLSSAKNNLEVVEMRNIDLVRTLLSCGVHPLVVVIDNKYREVSDDDQLLQMYDFITDILQRLMIGHLNTVGHAAGRELDEIGQERLRMDWQTQHNFDACGVFAMRHIETYMGDMRTWKTGLTQEGKTQESQIANLRMKYVAKLLVSNYNKKKEYVIKEVEKFQSMDEAIRKKLRKHVDDTKTERLRI
ncbi:hypothetical protein Ccrd_024718 [Cynara cardunculus var. scolymus]|uniref:Ubiquitin-like protease family profile domain-containing protein n=1 Tax=Cynara cardunculus var. scolymus TaxID=59895 RepID=A0A103XC02_CYNCS|nr:hypothetical protein Ccrd_024718 [Cynara cardunculus var. scolymus]